MATTSIIDVEVRDQAFQTLKDQFDKFNAAVKAQPAAWAAVGQNAHAVRVAIGGAQASMAGLTAGTNLAVVANTNLVRQAASAKTIFAGLVEDSRKLGRNVEGVTKQLLSWVGIGGIFGGLLGGVGLFGLDRLAAGVSTQRRSAQGVGVSVGEQSAFRLNYSRYTNTDSLLTKVADARQDYSKMSSFALLGITSDQVQSMGTAELSQLVMRRSRDVYRQYGRNATMAGAMHLTDFQSLEDLRREDATPDADFDKSDRDYTRDQSSLDITNQVQKAWQDLATQLERAGDQIEIAFVKGLAPLAPSLTKLSDGFAKLVTATLANPRIAEWIDSLSKGMERFAGYIGTTEFSDRIERFVTTIGNLLLAFERAVEWLAAKIVPASDPAAPAGTGNSPIHADGTPRSFFERLTGLGGGAHNDPIAGAPQMAAPDRWKFAHDYLRTTGGYTEVQVAAMLGHLQGEDSDLDTTKINPAGGGEGARGIAQWRGERLARFRAMHGGRDVTQATLQEQLEFMVWEMHNTHASVGRDLARANTPEQGVQPMLDGFGFGLGPNSPVPAEEPALLAQRRLGAQEFYRRFGTTPVAPGTPSQTPVVAPVNGPPGSPTAAFAAAAAHIGQSGPEVNDFLHANGQSLDAAHTAWCAAFVNASLRSVGIQGSGSAIATSFANWGRVAGWDDVHPGDVAVQMRGRPAGATGGHVGFASGQTRTRDGRLEFELLSGNATSTGQVSRQWMDASQFDLRRGATDAAAPPRSDPNAAPEEPMTPPGRSAAPPIRVGSNDTNIFIYDLTGGNIHIAAAAAAA